MSKALYSPYSGYILYDAVWSGTAPMTAEGYSLARFATIRPDWRVKWASTSATITATIGASRKADIFALPMSNITPGSTTVLALTNGGGLSVAITMPALPPDDIPTTLAIDLRPLASAGTRTSNVWHVVITSNGVAVTLGAAIWLGTITDATEDITYGFVRGETRYNGSKPNFFGTVNRVRTRCKVSWVDASFPSHYTQMSSIYNWFKSGEGTGLPSVFWPVPSIADGALLGTWPDEFQATQELRNLHRTKMRFTELSKGVPLL